MKVTVDMAGVSAANGNAPAWRREYARRRRVIVRELVFDHYGRACVCCGETYQPFLTIDHIDGGGRAHRRLLGTPSIYGWLVSHDFPPEFQTMCHNCNFAKHSLGECACQVVA